MMGLKSRELFLHRYSNEISIKAFYSMVKVKFQKLSEKNRGVV